MRRQSSPAVQLGLDALFGVPAPAPSTPVPVAPVEAPAGRPRVERAPEHEDPADIAREIQRELCGAIDACKGLISELNGTAKASPTVEIAILDGAPFVVTSKEGVAPVAANDLLRAFRERYPVSYAELYDASVAMGSPPREKLRDIGDMLTDALGRANERAADEIVKLRGLHAEILGCSVDELDARLTAEKQATADARATKLSAKRARATVDKAPPAPIAQEAVPTNAVAMRRLTDRQRELLAVVHVEDGRAVFGSDEHVGDWDELKRVLVALGGKWRTGGKAKKGGFVFAEGTDVDEVVRLAQTTGEILDPRLVGYVPTPAPLADVLVAWMSPQPFGRYLEPEAGTGRIALAIRRAEPSAVVTCYELLDTHRAELARLGFEVAGSDFLARLTPRTDAEAFDGCAMNPPFENGADIRHVRHAARFLREGAKLAAIVSAGAMFRSDKAATEFRAFVAAHGTMEALPEGSFAEEGTGVRTAIVRITACRCCHELRCPR